MPITAQSARNLSEFLTQQGALSAEQAADAHAHATAHALLFREAVVRLEMLSDTDIQRLIRAAGVPVYERLGRPSNDALNAVNAKTALQTGSVPLFIEAGILALGMLDPFDGPYLRQLERASGVRIRPHAITLTTFRSLSQAIARRGGDQQGGSKVVVDPDAMRLVPKDVAERHRIMPLRLQGDTLQLAVADDSDVIMLDNIAMLTGKRVIPVQMAEATIIALMRRSYSADDLTDLVREAAEETAAYSGADEVLDLDSVDDNALVRSINTILRDAVLADASDIHVEPMREGVRVRFRRDGELRHYIQFPRTTAAALIARLKIMANLNIAERRASQDGRITFRDAGAETDMRVSILPVSNGEKAVMRILKKEQDILEIEDLGFTPDNLEIFQGMIRKPYGMILVTGPTGSGKSFTSFSVLKRLNRPTINIVTIEDPIEYEVKGINQVAVNLHSGLTFDRAVRSFLRQDPDIILVGEIRDGETAKAATEAAITGHLLLSTLHTNDAPGAITRLREMGVESYNIAGSLLGVIAQRLVRRVCKHCAESDEANEELLGVLNEGKIPLENPTWKRGAGCSECDETGYLGRAAIHEIMALDDDMGNAIVNGASANDVRDMARKRGLRTLREDGLVKAARGITTLDEVFVRTRE
jgi:type IV pilus assembly protein PilB